MNTDKQDEVINQLYQQRKNAVIAPDIQFPKNASFKAEHSSWAKLLVALFGGSLASFGILAVISHLAISPVTVQPAQTETARHNPVEYQEDDLSKLQAEAVERAIDKFTLGLPQVPKTPERVSQHITAEYSEFPVIASAMLNDQLMLTIKQPAINISVSHKVLPEFPVAAMQNQRTGYVALSYQVSLQGRVENIRVIEGSAYRPFEQSAISALEQWHYVNNKRINDDNYEYQIVFEFITID